MDILLNNSLHSPKVGIYTEKTPELLPRAGYSDFGAFGRQNFCGNCKGCSVLTPIDMTKPLDSKKGLASKRCSRSKNILAQVSFNGQEMHQLFLMHYRQRHLTDCLEILEKFGFVGDTAIFVLSYLGGAL